MLIIMASAALSSANSAILEVRVPASSAHSGKTQRTRRRRRKVGGQDVHTTLMRTLAVRTGAFLAELFGKALFGKPWICDDRAAGSTSRQSPSVAMRLVAQIGLTGAPVGPPSQARSRFPGTARFFTVRSEGVRRRS